MVPKSDGDCSWYKLATRLHASAAERRAWDRVLPGSSPESASFCSSRRPALPDASSFAVAVFNLLRPVHIASFCMLLRDRSLSFLPATALASRRRSTPRPARPLRLEEHCAAFRPASVTLRRASLGKGRCTGAASLGGRRGRCWLPLRSLRAALDSAGRCTMDAAETGTA